MNSNIQIGNRLSCPVLIGILVMLLVWGTALTPTRADEFDYGEYTAVLSGYVNDRGMVNYRELVVERERLDSFVDSLAILSKTSYNDWSDAQKIAFLINAYNILTLRAVIDHYPIDPSGVSGLVFPDNSIRQIPGVWDKITFDIMDEPWTLDRIEHETLRVYFDEPRIHLALVCAAMGCPPLRNEPYTGDQLDSQLDDQAYMFLADSHKFKIDRENGRVFLSSIFKWYGDDFIPSFGTDNLFTDHNRTERAVLNYIVNYLSDSDRTFLESGEYRIEYLPYDWLLNEQ